MMDDGGSSTSPLYKLVRGRRRNSSLKCCLISFGSASEGAEIYSNTDSTLRSMGSPLPALQPITSGGLVVNVQTDQYLLCGQKR